VSGSLRVRRLATLTGNLALFVPIHAGEASWIPGHSSLLSSIMPLVDGCQPENVARHGPPERVSHGITRFDDPRRKRTTRDRLLFPTNYVPREIPTGRLMSAREAAKRESIALEVQDLIVPAQAARELPEPFEGFRHSAISRPDRLQAPRLRLGNRGQYFRGRTSHRRPSVRRRYGVAVDAFIDSPRR
jgi:hypothetical protein